MRTALKVFGFCLLALVAGAISSLLLNMFHPAVIDGARDIKYTDFLSITLTALSLMITVLGLFVAAAGVIGWTTLESKLRSHSVEYFSKQLERDGPLRKELEEFFAEIAYSGIEGLRDPITEERPYAD